MLLKRTFDLGLLSKHRNFLYGVATILVVWCHMIVELPATGVYPLFTWVQQRGMVGVEMFLMLSGFGLYSSLSRNQNVIRFYKRRILRVMLPAFIITVVIGAVAEGSFWEYVKYVTIIPGFFSEMGYWYPAFIIMIYAFYPLLFSFQKRSQKAFAMFSIAVSLLCIGVCVVMDMSLFYERAITRIPSFLVGCVIAPYVIEKRKIPVWLMVAAFVAFAGFDALRILLDFNGLSVRALAFFALSILLIWLSALMAEFLCSVSVGRGIYKLGAFIGTISLEMYMVHTRLRSLLEKVFVTETSLLSDILKVDVSAILLAVFAAYALSLLTRKLTEEFSAIKVPEKTNT